MKQQRIQQGVTLIELLIAIVIVGLLMSVAVPAYQNSTLKTRRSDGVAILNDIMQAQERWYTQQQTYTTTLTDLGYGVDASVPSREGFYQVTAAACAGTTIDQCVQLTATAQGAQVEDGNLTFNSRGSKTRDGNDGW